MTQYGILPYIGSGGRHWRAAALPELVKLCPICGGKGRYEQTYTVGCGGGYYQRMGECSYCKETGLRYWNGKDVPLSVLQQIVVAHQRLDAADANPG